MKTRYLISTVALASLSLLSAAMARPVKHDLGVTEVNDPKRIVVLEYSFADDLASVGVKPVGMAREKDGLPYLKRALGVIPEVGTRANPNLEKIAALKPDLIIADTSRHKGIYSQLQQIAPTIVFNSRYADFDSTIDQFKTISTIVGKGKEGQKVVRDLRKDIKETRAGNKHAAPVLLGNSYNTKTFSVYNDKTFVAEFLDKVGFPSIVKGDKPEIQPMSLESVVALQPQRVVILKNEGDDSIYSVWKNNPLWESIPAAKQNRVQLFDRLLWAKGRGPMAAELMLEQLEDSDLYK